MKQSIYQSAIKRVCADNDAPAAKSAELLEKYEGREDELFVKLCRKYDVQPSFYLELESGIREDYRTVQYAAPRQNATQSAMELGTVKAHKHGVIVEDFDEKVIMDGSPNAAKAVFSSSGS